MSMTTVANPRTPGPPREPHTTSTRNPNQTMAINPYPLTTAPPYGRRSRSTGRRRECRRHHGRCVGRSWCRRGALALLLPSISAVSPMALEVAALLAEQQRGSMTTAADWAVGSPDRARAWPRSRRPTRRSRRVAADLLGRSPLRFVRCEENSVASTLLVLLVRSALAGESSVGPSKRLSASPPAAPEAANEGSPIRASAATIVLGTRLRALRDIMVGRLSHQSKRIRGNASVPAARKPAACIWAKG